MARLDVIKMKKLLGILVLGLLVSTNYAQAGFIGRAGITQIGMSFQEYKKVS